jgi:hypothetical protein
VRWRAADGADHDRHHQHDHDGHHQHQHHDDPLAGRGCGRDDLRGPGRRAVVAASRGAGAQAPSFAAAGGGGALVDAVRTMCPHDVARLESGLDLERRVTATRDALIAVFDAPDDDMLTGFGCPGPTAEVDAHNPTAEPLGLIGGGRAGPAPFPVGEGDSEPVDVGVVVWSLPPGTQHLSFPLAEATDACGLWVVDFAADPGPADAAAPAGPGPATTGDDPSAWLPELIRAELAGQAAPTVDTDADVRDLRWLRRVDGPDDPDADVHPLLGITACPGTTDQPDADHLAVAYRAEYDEAIVPSPIGTLSHPGYSTLELGAFRRGADGRWRRLAAPIPLTGAAMASDCGPFRPHP